eukprot:262873-Prymnesium_polylepis.1
MNTGSPAGSMAALGAQHSSGHIIGVLYTAWVQPMVTGILVGVMMAVYVFLLNCTMNALWQNPLVTESLPPGSAHLSPTGYANRRWAVV